MVQENHIVSFSDFITDNNEIKEIIEKLKQIQDDSINILLEGETGTGKDFLAKATHYSSKRKDKRFVTVSCAALPETLLENELFGHKRGAYTGADKDQAGLIEVAEGGTLYMDEIAETSESTQIKLLRAIEEKEITRLGETKPRKIDVRIISSTSRNIEEAVGKDDFRKDLYFRINTIHFKLPPLRERKDDIPLLIQHFLKKENHSDLYGKIKSDNLLEIAFSSYEWEGNVRELENGVKRLIVLSQNNEVTKKLLIQCLYQQSKYEKKPLRERVADYERGEIVQTLGAVKNLTGKYDLNMTAKLLGTHVETLKDMIERYEIKLEKL